MSLTRTATLLCTNSMAVFPWAHQASRRAKRPNPIPCFIYIDECNEFVANDQNAIDIIRKLRRKCIALILGNQAVEDIHSPRQAFLGTRIKLINADEDSAKELAKNMNLRNGHGAPETSQLVGVLSRFCLPYSRRYAGTEQFKVPFMHMENMSKMTEEEWEQVRQQIEDRYYVPVKHQPTYTPSVSTVPQEVAPEPKPKSQPQQNAPEPKLAEPPAPRIEPEQQQDTEGATSWDGMG